MTRRRAVRLRVPLSILTALALLAGAAPVAGAMTSHAGWPEITGILLMNKRDQTRPLDGRLGADIFGGQDRSYSCDGLHKNHRCATAAGRASRVGHNELLGGHGSDTIFAGPFGDVIWGDFKPAGQPTSQVDRIFGGEGKDIIFASHGYNVIDAGAGNDWLKAHWGRGIIDCGPGNDILYVSRRAQKGYTIRNCERISHKSLGY
jgi:Ca2+-binding RTX toxin-like protein